MNCSEATFILEALQEAMSSVAFDTIEAKLRTVYSLWFKLYNCNNSKVPRWFGITTRIIDCSGSAGTLTVAKFKKIIDATNTTEVVNWFKKNSIDEHKLFFAIHLVLMVIESQTYKKGTQKDQMELIDKLILLVGLVTQ